LEDNKFRFTTENLPCLIHGIEHSGASQFTVSVIADLYKQGFKILFLSGYPMAREELVSQIEEPDDTVLFDDENKLQSSFSKRVIFIPREKEELFIEAAHTLPDIDDRVILVKNIDLFNAKIFEAVKDRKKIILSGDLDKCIYKDQILKLDFKTKILFSQPIADIEITIPKLEKYKGYLFSGNSNGIISLGA
jgi:hypothetical protein